MARGSKPSASTAGGRGSLWSRLAPVSLFASRPPSNPAENAGGAAGIALATATEPGRRGRRGGRGGAAGARGWPLALWQAVRQDPRWLFTLVLAALIFGAIFAPLVAPYSPLLYHPLQIARPPSLAHPFGTDDLGRDQLSRVIYGARISLSVGIVSIALGVAAGGLLGVLGGFLGGWVDQGITIISDALLAFPALILALAITAALGGSVINLVVALAVVRVPLYARLARGQTLQVRSLDYIMAARSVGTRRRTMIIRHVVPNIVAPVLVQATISISLAILDESVLSFLGLGAQPPTPEWGAMINTAQIYLASDPWMMMGPAAVLALTVLSFNLVGDALRDRLDPRSVDLVTPPKTVAE